jgi:hypothetical protein
MFFLAVLNVLRTLGTNRLTLYRIQRLFNPLEIEPDRSQSVPEMTCVNAPAQKVIMFTVPQCDRASSSAFVPERSHLLQSCRWLQLLVIQFQEM